MSETRPDPVRSLGDGGGTSQAGGGHHSGLAHVLPLRVLAGVWIALMVLTWITVAVTWVDLGKANLWIAMIIATIKGTLVALYFMHLRYDRPINGVIFIGSLIFVMLFVGTVLLDTTAYQPELIPGYAPAMPQTPTP